ncbi:MAG: class I SAM-dependent methyltransferase [Cyanobacteria bacterium P01_F01_bin.86]
MTKLSRLVTLLTRSGKSPYSFALYGQDGESLNVGESEIAFKIYIKNKAGFDACMSLNELLIAEAYMGGDINLEGDLIKVILSFQDMFSDRSPILKSWRIIKPLLFGREKCNPEWIAKHYDSNNLQLLSTENDYDTYTPGIYHSDDESMNVAAKRKLTFAFDSLQLKPHDHVLDVGCGWGGFLRFAAARDVRVTGITLSQHQTNYVQALIDKQNFTNANVQYQDFFTYTSPEKFDGISMMGVIEDLADYEHVMKKLPDLLKPGGRVYLDFAADEDPFSATRSFVTKYIWPGAFRLVYMPKFVEAVQKSFLEIHSIYNDRHNYHLWAKKAYETLFSNKEPFVEKSNEYLWRMFTILHAGTSAAFIKTNYFCTAYRVLLELPCDREGVVSSSPLRYR